MSVIQIILITLVGFIQPIDDYGPQLFSENKIFYGALTGLLLGDLTTGLYIGAACHLMSLGVVAIGGSSVPNYNMAAIIGTAITVTTGQSVEVGIVIGSAVGMLGIQFEVLHHIVSGFIARKAEDFCDRGEFGKMQLMIPLSSIVLGCFIAIPVFIACAFGADAVNFVLDVLPTWFTTGLQVAGGLMPAVGMAMLLNFMPAKQYFGCLLVGFALATFAGWGIIPIAMVAGAWAFEKYKSISARNNYTIETGGMEDE